MKLTLDSWRELCGEMGSRAQSIRYESSREAAGEDASASEARTQWPSRDQARKRRPTRVPTAYVQRRHESSPERVLPADVSSLFIS